MTRRLERVFGEGNVLIVGNPAGTQHDVDQFQVRSTMRGNIDAQTFSQAESVSYHLAVPVLRHNSPKPARYLCIKSIPTYFSTLRVPIKEAWEIVGDRIFMDDWRLAKGEHDEESNGHGDALDWERIFQDPFAKSQHSS